MLILSIIGYLVIAFVFAIILHKFGYETDGIVVVSVFWAPFLAILIVFGLIYFIFSRLPRYLLKLG